MNTDILPDAGDGATLGSATKEWSDLYLADGAIIYFGDDQEITLQHVHDTGLQLQGDLLPSAGDTYHIGSATAKWKDLHLNGNAIIDGNLTVNGSTTTINSTTLDVDDLNITIASGAANSAAADGAGITVDGASATLTYVDATTSWNFNKNLHVLKDTDAEAHFGRASIGSPVTDVAYFAHTDNLTTTSYALKQDANGFTRINAALGQVINLSLIHI